jgi:hypothetical protein
MCPEGGRTENEYRFHTYEQLKDNLKEAEKAVTAWW